MRDMSDIITVLLLILAMFGSACMAHHLWVENNTETSQDE